MKVITRLKELQHTDLTTVAGASSLVANSHTQPDLPTHDSHNFPKTIVSTIAISHHHIDAIDNHHNWIARIVC